MSVACCSGRSDTFSPVCWGACANCCSWEYCSLYCVSSPPSCGPSTHVCVVALFVHPPRRSSSLALPLALVCLPVNLPPRYTCIVCTSQICMYCRHRRGCTQTDTAVAPGMEVCTHVAGMRVYVYVCWFVYVCVSVCVLDGIGVSMCGFLLVVALVPTQGFGQQLSPCCDCASHCMAALCARMTVKYQRTLLKVTDRCTCVLVDKNRSHRCCLGTALRCHCSWSILGIVWSLPGTSAGDRRPVRGEWSDCEHQVWSRV